MSKWVHLVVILLLSITIVLQQYTVNIKDEIITDNLEMITLQQDIIRLKDKRIAGMRGLSSSYENGNCTKGSVHEPTGAWECKDCSFATMMGQLCWDGKDLYFGDGDQVLKVNWQDSVDESSGFPNKPIIEDFQR